MCSHAWVPQSEPYCLNCAGWRNGSGSTWGNSSGSSNYDLYDSVMIMHMILITLLLLSEWLALLFFLYYSYCSCFCCCYCYCCYWYCYCCCCCCCYCCYCCCCCYCYYYSSSCCCYPSGNDHDDELPRQRPPLTARRRLQYHHIESHIKMVSHWKTWYPKWQQPVDS